MLLREPASYRDYRARVVYQDRDVYRMVLPAGVEDYRRVRRTLHQLVTEGLLLACDEVDSGPFTSAGAVHVVHHPRIRSISYPYEWTFEMLRAAALLHIDFHLRALDLGATLSDGSAYNIQFLNTEPIFIDCTSVLPYEPNSYWAGYGQFCDQFLNPLVLASRGRIPFQRWYRGAPEGLPPEWIERTLPLSARFSLDVLINVHLNARGRRHAQVGNRSAEQKLPLVGLKWLLRSLRRLILGLPHPPVAVASVVEYGRCSPHSSAYQEAKRDAVAHFAAEIAPRRLLDMGCNTGSFSRIAVEHGAGMVVGLEADPSAADDAFAQARTSKLPILTLVIDLHDPSPGQGWSGKERRPLDQRIDCDALMALALIHHLCITRRIPLPDVVDWLVSLAPQGLIEFIPPDDPWVQELSGNVKLDSLAYSSDRFESELRSHANIISATPLVDSKRVLFRYRRN